MAETSQFPSGHLAADRGGHLSFAGVLSSQIQVRLGGSHLLSDHCLLSFLAAERTLVSQTHTLPVISYPEHRDSGVSFLTSVPVGVTLKPIFKNNRTSVLKVSQESSHQLSYH